MPVSVNQAYGQTKGQVRMGLSLCISGLLFFYAWFVVVSGCEDGGKESNAD